MAKFLFLKGVDQSRLNAFVAAALKFSTRTPERVVNSTLYHVAKKTLEYTPAVSQAQIDTELGTAVVLQAKKRGSGFKRAKRGELLSSGRTVSMSRGQKSFNVPLAAAIIQASVIRPDVAASTPTAKRYNQRTNFRWARLASPFRGVSRAVGRSLMRAKVSRLIKTRHSSTHFLKAGWIAVLKEARSKLYGGAPPLDTPTESKADFGRFTPARAGIKVFGVIANLIGLAGSRNSQNYNRALHLHSGPALQRAVNEQAESMARHYADRIYKAELLPIARANGIRVNN
jgi:hypothetical protein